MNNTSNIIEESIKIVSPAWPLKSFVAVNPFWNLKEKNFYKVLSELTQIYGQSLFLPLSLFVKKYNEGLIKKEDIEKSIKLIADFGIFLSQDYSLFIRESLEANEHEINYQTYSDFLSNIESSHAKNQIVDEISKYCASYFDLGQAPFSLKNASKSLYLEWRELVVLDKSFMFLGYQVEKIDLSSIPKDPIKLIEKCAIQLGISAESDLRLYIMKICHHIMGWSSHICFQLWQENLGLSEKNRGTKIEDIIAIFIFYECLMQNSRKELNNRWAHYYNQQKIIFSSKNMDLDHNFKLLSVWQRALELSYQEKIIQKIIYQGFQEKFRETEKNVQMVFCIDVRSEVIRRKIEDHCPGVSTHGFAGFFGVSLNCTSQKKFAKYVSLPCFNPAKNKYK